MKNKEIEELLKNIKDKYSYEPYDNTGNVYTTISYEEGQLLSSYIEQLQTTAKDCKQKLDQYENPDDLTLFYMWLDEKAKDKMKQLENNRDKALRIIDKYKETYIICFDKEQWNFVKRLEKCLQRNDK